LLTVVGYDRQIPDTMVGRLVSLPYAVVGIPLAFNFLFLAGRDLARCVLSVYRRLCCDVLCCKLCDRRRRRRIYSAGGAGVGAQRTPDGASSYALTTTTGFSYILRCLKSCSCTCFGNFQMLRQI